MTTQENPVTQDQAAKDLITIPRPHIPYGPARVDADEADAQYLRKAATDLADHYQPFGSNLRAAVVKLIRDAANAIAAQAPAASEQVCPGCGRMAPVADSVFLRHSPTQEDVDECGQTGCTIPAPGEQPTISDLLKARVQQLTEERNTLRRQVKQAKTLANAFVDEHAISDPASAAVLEILAALTSEEQQ